MKRILSHILLFSFVLSSINPLLAAEKQSFFGGFKRGVQSLASQASSKIKGGLGSALKSARRMGPAAVVSQLEKQIDSLGTKTKTIAECIIQGNRCTAAQRAAFIGTSVTVLALTVAAVGATISVAATSKEVDKVAQVTSKEVEGWGAEQVFQRLTNTINDFKVQLSALKQGILKKELTRGQKRFLYSAALSIAALVTIAVAVGVGSAVYAQQKEKQAAQPSPQGAPSPGMTREEEFQAQQQAIAEEAKAKGLSEQEIQALLDELGTFDDEPSMTQEESRNPFKRYFLSKINVVKGGPRRLRAAFDDIKRKIRSGALKTKEGIVQAYMDAVNFTNNLPSILNDALGVSIDKMQAGYADVKQALDTFATSISNPSELLQGVQPFSQDSFIGSLRNFIAYGMNMNQLYKGAKDALDQLGKLQIAHAKVITPEEYAAKVKVLDTQEAAIRDKDQRDREALLDKKKTAADERVALAQQQLSDRNLRRKQRQLDDRISKYSRQLNELEQDTRERLAKNKKSRSVLALQQKLDAFTTPKLWLNQYIPTLVERINTLQLEPAGQVAQVVMTALGGVFKGATFLAQNGGKIGELIFPQIGKIAFGTRQLSESIPRVGAKIRELLSIQPLIVMGDLSTTDILKAFKTAATQKRGEFLRQNKDKLQLIINNLQAINGRYDPLRKKINGFADWFKDFGKITLDEIKAAFAREKGLSKLSKSAKIVRDAVISVVEKQKMAWNAIIEDLPFITNKASEMLADASTVLTELNTSVKEIVGDAPLNQRALQVLAEIIQQYANVNEGLKAIREGSLNYAAAAA